MLFTAAGVDASFLKAVNHKQTVPAWFRAGWRHHRGKTLVA